MTSKKNKLRAAKLLQRRYKKKPNPLNPERIVYIDYKDINLLQRFMSDRSKLKARRMTGADVQQQRDIATAVRVHAHDHHCRLGPLQDFHGLLIRVGNGYEIQVRVCFQHGGDALGNHFVFAGQKNSYGHKSPPSESHNWLDWLANCTT